MEKKPLHVVPAMNGGWVIRRSGSMRATKRFDTQKEAEEYARRVMVEQKGELVIHKIDGTILRKQSFHVNPEPIPPCDR
jgi:hypothetical protein